MRTQLFSSGKTVGGWLASAAFAMSIASVTHATTTIEGVGSPPTSVDVERWYGFQSWATDTDGRAVRLPRSRTNPRGLRVRYHVRASLRHSAHVGGRDVCQKRDLRERRDFPRASLPTFSIVVVGEGGSTSGGGTTTTPPSSGQGSATVSWQPPTTNTNGSAINNLAGYTIYYGTSTNSYSTVKVANPGLTSYTISNLAPGAYSFAVVAYNSAGESSQYSSVATKTIK